MAAHASKIAVALVMGAVLFIPASAEGSHGGSARCMGRWATIVAQGGDEVVRGTEGDDVIVGSAVSDTIMGLGGDDLICAGHESDVVYAGEGNDRVLGEAGDDELFGGGGTDLLYGGDGSDVVMGQDGNDIVRGGPDGRPAPTMREIVSGGAGDDLLLNGSAIDSFIGGAGDDSFVFRAGIAVVDLERGAIVSDTDVVDSIAGVENVLGFPRISGDDPGRPVDPVIRGDGMDNILVGGPASDHIFGEGGNDLVDGYCGTDHLDGGAGSEDVASFRFQGNVSADLATGTAGSSTSECGSGRNSAALSSLEGLAGGDGWDVLIGDAGNNYIYGGPGWDVLSGMAGDDVLDGSIDGGSLSGGDGVDRCLNADETLDCEAGAGPAGPRRRGAVELLQRFARVLEMVELAQRLVSI